MNEEYPVMIKINCDDFMDQGLSLVDSSYVSELLSDLGVNLIEVSGGSYSSRAGEGAARVANKPEQESYFKEFATRIAEKVNFAADVGYCSNQRKSGRSVCNED